MVTDALLLGISNRLGKPRFDSAIHVPNPASALEASTDKYILQIGRARWILIVSSRTAPLIVKRGADLQRDAKSLLAGSAAEAVELPIIEGFWGEQSYALWRMRQPLSSNRILRKIETVLLAPKVFRWLRDAASMTVKPIDRTIMAARLQRLQSVPSLRAYIKTAAEAARADVLSARIPALQVMQHGDLWIGNVVKAPSKTRFVLVDWGGARMDGAPFYDLMKFATSIGAGASRIADELDRHGALLGCDSGDAASYVLCGLGRLYSELEDFPENMFVELCEQKFNALRFITKDQWKAHYSVGTKELIDGSRAHGMLWRRRRNGRWIYCQMTEEASERIIPFK